MMVSCQWLIPFYDMAVVVVIAIASLHRIASHHIAFCVNVYDIILNHNLSNEMRRRLCFFVSFSRCFGFSLDLSVPETLIDLSVEVSLS